VSCAGEEIEDDAQLVGVQCFGGPFSIRGRAGGREGGMNGGIDKGKEGGREGRTGGGA